MLKRAIHLKIFKRQFFSSTKITQVAPSRPYTLSDAEPTVCNEIQQSNVHKCRKTTSPQRPFIVWPPIYTMTFGATNWHKGYHHTAEHSQ